MFMLILHWRLSKCRERVGRGREFHLPTLFSSSGQKKFTWEEGNAEYIVPKTRRVQPKSNPFTVSSACQRLAARCALVFQRLFTCKQKRQQVAHSICRPGNSVTSTCNGRRLLTHRTELLRGTVDEKKIEPSIAPVVATVCPPTPSVSFNELHEFLHDVE